MAYLPSLSDLSRMTVIQLRDFAQTNQIPLRDLINRIEESMLSPTTFNLPEPVIFNILLNSDLETIDNLCRTHPRIREICKKEYFWQQKYIKDYGDPKIGRPTVSWEKLYKYWTKSQPRETYTLSFNTDIIAVISEETLNMIDDIIAIAFNQNLINHPLYSIGEYVYNRMIQLEIRESKGDGRSRNQIEEEFRANTKTITPDEVSELTRHDIDTAEIPFI